MDDSLWPVPYVKTSAGPQPAAPPRSPDGRAQSLALLRRAGIRQARRHDVDDAGNLVWTFGPAPHRLAFPLTVVFTVGEEGLGGLRGARDACRELAPGAVLALEGHGSDRVFVEAVGSFRVRFTVTGPGGHSWWNRGRPSAVHELVRLLHGMIASASAQLPVNVGLIDGGTGVNAIAAQASATVEWRATDQALLDRQEAALAGQEVSPGLRLSVEHLDRRPGAARD